METKRHFLEPSREASSHLPGHQRQCLGASALYLPLGRHRDDSEGNEKPLRSTRKHWLDGGSSLPSGLGRKGCICHGKTHEPCRADLFTASIISLSICYTFYLELICCSTHCAVPRGEAGFRALGQEAPRHLSHCN